jgi:TolA-binding protein
MIDEGLSPAGLPETSAALLGSVPAAEPEQGAAEIPQSSVPALSAPEGPPAAALPLAQDIPPDQYLQQAQEEFKAGRVAAALSILDQFREWYPSGSDEAYWLYGQFYEANSPSRDIRLSLDYYRRLVREYPQSSRYSEARRRIDYLERYYINIQ